jgi:hypothetical protein
VNSTIIGKQYGTLKQDSYVLTEYNGPIAAGFLTSGDPRGGAMNAGQWYFVAMNYSSSPTQTAYLFLNGAVQDSQAGLSISPDGNPVLLGAEGKDAAPAQFFNGILDELRISNVARDSNWIRTEYNNYNTPNSFYTLGPQESNSCGPAWVQTTATYTGSVTTSQTITFGQPSTAGNFIVVSSDWGNQTADISSVTDSKHNTYAKALGPTNLNTTGRAATWYASNIAGGGAATTITVTLNGPASGSPAFEIYATEYSGIAALGPVDQSSATTSGLGVAKVMTSGSVSTTQASELIYGFGWSLGGTATVDNPPSTPRSTYRGNFVADQIVSATGTYSITGTLDKYVSWLCHIVTFKGK